MFIVIKGVDYEGHWVSGVFSTRQDAEIHVANSQYKDSEEKYSPRYRYEIEEWELDSVSPS